MMKKVLLIAPMGSIHRRFNRANIEALQKLQYVIYLMANFEDGEGAESQNSEFVKWCKSQNIQIESVGFSRGSFKKNIPYISVVKEYLKYNSFDIVHAHTETGGLILSLCHSVKGNTKFIYTPHGLSFYEGGPLIGKLIYKPIERWICSRMDTNLAMNTEELRLFSKWGSQKATFFHGIGIDLNRFKDNSNKKNVIRKEIGAPEDSLLMMSIGELNDNKNHASVINALSKISNTDIYYVICGVGALKDSLKQLIEAKGLIERVKLLGYRKDIPDVLYASDLFVFPSKHEGLPVSLMEAMAAGLPVICSKIRGCVDLVHEGINGYLFNPNEIEDIKKVIEKILSERTKWQEYSINNLRDVINYSHEVVVEEMMRVYQ